MGAPGSEPRKSRIRRENRRRILDAAEHVFAESGFAGARMSEIAQRAGLPKANLHYYFGTKEELYRAVLDAILAEWSAKLDRWTADADPGDTLRAYIREKLEFSRLRPQASKVFANEMIHGAPVLGDYLSRDVRRLVEAKSAVVEAWVRRGRMAPVDGPNLIFMLWALTQHYADFEVQVRLVLGRSQLTAEDWDSISVQVENFVLRAVGVAT